MQRTTVRLPDELLRAAKHRAQQTGRTLTQLLEDSLRAELRQPTRSTRVSEPLPTYAGRGLHPGVDLSDASALEDVIDGR
ncbi:MAG: ribbon-helix-helix protein, CopG family [Gemmatimonadaceae bacterium]|nr:ribbon-helix-helix protein, CopG family [Gemmatimonadaceae bacterium]